MPVRSFLVLGESDPLEAERIPKLLGLLCTNPDEPLAGYAPKDPSRFYTEPPSVIALSNTKTVVDSIENADARTRIGGVFEGLLEEGARKGFTIKAQTVRTFKLPQQEEVLAKMWSDEETRREIKNLMGWWNPRKLYMIVGFKSCINADVGYLEQHMLRSRLSVSIKEAVELLAAAGAPVPPWLNIMIEAGKDKSMTLVQTCQIFGEVVFAVRYREVSRRSAIVRKVLGDCFPHITERPVTDIPNGTMVFAPGDEPQPVVDEELDLDKWRGLQDDDIPADEQDDMCIVPHEDDPDLPVENGAKIPF